jgi:hypothetical protein
MVLGLMGAGGHKNPSFLFCIFSGVSYVLRTRVQSAKLSSLHSQLANLMIGEDSSATLPSTLP